MRISRFVAPVALLAVVIAVVIVITGSGKTSSAPATTKQTAGTHGHHRHRATARSRLVRNATPQPDWTPHTGPVPILVYHQLGDPPPGEPYPALFTSDADFKAEMAWLHEHGYQGVTLDEVMKAWYHGGTLPTKPIVITFDDGVVPQVTFAPAVLSRYGWPGVLNEVIVDHLSDARLKRIVAMGWEVDSHTVNHLDLTTLSSDQLRYQLVASRRYLRAHLHIPVNGFCYPASRYDTTVIAAVKAAGYTFATIENAAYATPASPYTLSRFEMTRTTGVSGLAADLARQ